jgi:hypothetical protein
VSDRTVHSPTGTLHCGVPEERSAAWTGRGIGRWRTARSAPWRRSGRPIVTGSTIPPGSASTGCRSPRGGGIGTERHCPGARTVRTAAAGPCRRKVDREVGRVTDRTARDPSGWRDGTARGPEPPPPRRSFHRRRRHRRPREGSGHGPPPRSAPERSDAPEDRPGRDRTREGPRTTAGAHSRSAHPQRRPRWARKGARGRSRVRGRTRAHCRRLRPRPRRRSRAHRHPDRRR